MKGLEITSVILLFLHISKVIECANILYIVPFTSMSHYIMLRPIGLELARRGHNVTIITAYKETDHPPNYHQVFAEDKKKIWDVLGIERPNVFTMVDLSSEHFHDLILWRGGVGTTEIALNSSQVQALLKNDNKFDLIISEQFYQEAFYVLAHKYNAPLVLVTTYGNCMRHNIVTRNPLQLATVISEFLPLEDPTSFYGRLRNMYFTFYEYYWWKYWYLGKQEELVKKYVPNLSGPVPSLYELQKNASLVLINSHFSFDPPTAYLPNVIEIGGIHLTKSDNQLPKDFQKLLDEAKHGVIYVNFGSNVQSTELPIEKRNAFLNVFRGLKETVLWKWEDEKLDNKPDNLFIRKWMPQKEIFSHPNIKVFISHGGLIGTQEAAFHGVPIIGIPIYADQYNNLLQAQHIGFGKILQYHDINEENLKRELNEMLTNKSYRIKAMEVSKRFKDRPVSALDSAMFWIEYVIRHKGSDFMKNPARNLSWIAYNLLDVYVFIFTVLAVFFCLIYRLINILFASKKRKTIAKKKTS